MLGGLASNQNDRDGPLVAESGRSEMGRERPLTTQSGHKPRISLNLANQVKVIVGNELGSIEKMVNTGHQSRRIRRTRFGSLRDQSVWNTA